MLITYFILVYYICVAWTDSSIDGYVNPITVIILNYLLCRIAVNLNESMPQKIDVKSVLKRSR